MLENLYEDIGGKIKNLAKWIFVIEAGIAVIAGFFLLEENTWAGLLALIGGPLVAWISSWILYAFGQIVEDVHAMRNKEGTTTEVKAKREAEASAKREIEERTQLQEKSKSQKFELSDDGYTNIEHSDDDYIEFSCPNCGEKLSFLKNETDAKCPECGAEFDF